METTVKESKVLKLMKLNKEQKKPKTYVSLPLTAFTYLWFTGKTDFLNQSGKEMP